MFDSNEFAIQVMAKGAFTDNATGDGKSYQVEATTIRLNHIALNAWHDTYTLNCRDCYQDGAAGDIEWNERQAECSRNLEAFHTKIKRALGIDEEKAVSITQNVSEVFTVVYIYENT